MEGGGGKAGEQVVTGGVSGRGEVGEGMGTGKKEEELEPVEGV